MSLPRTDGSDALRAFRDDGYCVLKQVLLAADIDAIGRAVQSVIDSTFSRDAPRASDVSHHVEPRNAFWIVNLRLLDRDVWRLVTLPTLVDHACALLETRSVSLLEDQFINKPPGGHGVRLHQDLSYFPLSRESTVVTCWIPLTDTTAEMGTLRLVPGSHRLGVGPPPPSLHGTDHDLADNTLVRSLGAAPRALDLGIRRGDVVCFDGALLHGSGDNTSTLWRPALSLHFAAEHSRFASARLTSTPEPALYRTLRDGDPVETPEIPRLSRSRAG